MNNIQALGLTLLFTDNNNIVTVIIVKISHVIFIFHDDTILKTAVPIGIDSVNSKERKLLVRAKTFEGRLVNNRELILGLTFPERYVANDNKRIPIIGDRWNRLDSPTNMNTTAVIFSRLSMGNFEK